MANRREEVAETLEESVLRFNVGGRNECFCGVRAPMWCSWSNDNPGRRFIGCPNYEDRKKSCKYFHWIDPDISERYKKIILILRAEIKLLKKDGEISQKEYSSSKDEETRLMKKVAKFKGKLTDLELEFAKVRDLEKKKLAMIKDKEDKLKKELAKRRGKERVYWLVIGFSWIITFGVIIQCMSLNPKASAKFLPV